MLNGTTLGWSIGIIGLIAMPFLAFSMLTTKTRVLSRTSSFWIADSVKSPRLLVLALAMIFAFMGMFTGHFSVPTYANMQDMDPRLAGYLSAVRNTASTFGRVISGVLADRLGKSNFLAVETFAIVVDFTSGTIIFRPFGGADRLRAPPRDVGTYSVMSPARGALGNLIGPPIMCAMVDH